MDALSLLLNRSSCSALQAPAPQGEALENILHAGMRAPDHGGLTPWHFTLIRGEGLVRLSECFVEALAGEQSPEKRERIAKVPFRAPLIIMVSTRLKEHEKVPAIEQVMAAGCTVMAMQMAAVAQGFQGIWRTGDYAYHPLIKERLGVAPNDHIVGYLYLGTPAKEVKPRIARDLSDWVSEL